MISRKIKNDTRFASSITLCRNEATRTPDPYVPNVVRYQLRYIPLQTIQTKDKHKHTKHQNGLNILTTNAINPRCTLYNKDRAKKHNQKIFAVFCQNICTSKKLVLPLHTQNHGAIAQLVEQRTENPCVPGSIPGGTTKKIANS